MRLGRGLLALGTLAALTAAAAPAHRAARMHLHLKASVPARDTVLAASPSTLSLWFSEKPMVRLTSVTVTGAAGPVKLAKPVADPKDETLVTVAVEGKLAPGAYTIAWRTASADGHPVKGTVPFRVK